MAFGIAVTDGTVVAEGTYGVIVRFNLLAYEVRTVRSIQLQLTTPSEVMGDVISAAVSVETLQGYLEDSAAPDAAFAQSGDILDVFLLATAYTYVSTIRLGVWFTRNAQNLASASEKLDIPQEARELAKALALQHAYIAKGKVVPYSIDQVVRSEKEKLGL